MLADVHRSHRIRRVPWCRRRHRLSTPCETESVEQIVQNLGSPHELLNRRRLRDHHSPLPPLGVRLAPLVGRALARRFRRGRAAWFGFQAPHRLIRRGVQPPAEPIAPPKCRSRDGWLRPCIRRRYDGLNSRHKRSSRGDIAQPRARSRGPRSAGLECCRAERGAFDNLICVGQR